MKLIDNASGNVDQGIVLEESADSYKLSYECSDIGDGRSFIIIYATLSDTSYKTYFFPVQFLGHNEIDFSIESGATFLQFKMVGNATVEGIALESIVNAAIEYVKANAGYWDRIKEITSNTGKVRTDMLEGLINMSLNAFANESGTITQENGILTFLNGSTPETSTDALQICGVGIRIAHGKKPDGTWDWTNSMTGAGIDASTIIAETFAALNITGVTITSGTITSGTITGVTIEGSTIYAGNRETGNYTEITSDGYINAYRNGKNTMSFGIYSSGTFYLGEDLDDFSKPRTIITSNGGVDNRDYLDIRTSNNDGIHLGLAGGSEVFIEQNNIRLLTPNHNGTVVIDGNLDLTGTFNHK